MNYNNINFSSNNNKNYNMIIYPSLQGLGAYIGYSIPLKDIDGPNIVSGMNGSHKLVLAKTKVANIVGKWKNALLGAFIGTGIAIIVDKIISIQNHKK